LREEDREEAELERDLEDEYDRLRLREDRELEDRDEE
jgi:hypothetical protein